MPEETKQVKLVERVLRQPFGEHIACYVETRTETNRFATYTEALESYNHATGEAALWQMNHCLRRREERIFNK